MRDVTGDREWRGGRRKGEEEPALQIKNRSRAPDYIATTINIATTGNDKASTYVYVCTYVCTVWSFLYGRTRPKLSVFLTVGLSNRANRCIFQH